MASSGPPGYDSPFLMHSTLDPWSKFEKRLPLALAKKTVGVQIFLTSPGDNKFKDLSSFKFRKLSRTSCQVRSSSRLVSNAKSWVLMTGNEMMLTEMLMKRGVGGSVGGGGMVTLYPFWMSRRVHPVSSLWSGQSTLRSHFLESSMQDPSSQVYWPSPHTERESNTCQWNRLI